MRKLAVAALAAVILAGAGFGVLRLEEELSEAGPGGDVLDIPVCENDPKTGLPLPGSYPMCPPIVPCAGCTYAPQPTPQSPPEPGLIKPDPGAALMGPAVHRVGDAVELARSDCPKGWYAAVSATTGMSICFPASAGEVTVGGTGEQVLEEDRFEITITEKGSPVVAIVNVLRSTGATFPHDLDCPNPQARKLAVGAALVCEWPGGRHQVYEGVESYFNHAVFVEKVGHQWVFDGVVWGTAGGDPGDIGGIERLILQVLDTWRLP